MNDWRIITKCICEDLDRFGEVICVGSIIDHVRAQRDLSGPGIRAKTTRTVPAGSLSYLQR